MYKRGVTRGSLGAHKSLENQVPTSSPMSLVTEDGGREHSLLLDHCFRETETDDCEFYTNASYSDFYRREKGFWEIWGVERGKANFGKAAATHQQQRKVLPVSCAQRRYRKRTWPGVPDTSNTNTFNTNTSNTNTSSTTSSTTSNTTSNSVVLKLCALV